MCDARRAWGDGREFVGLHLRILFQRPTSMEVDSVGVPALTVGYRLKTKPAHRRPECRERVLLSVVPRQQLAHGLHTRYTARHIPCQRPSCSNITYTRLRALSPPQPLCRLLTE